MVIYNFSTTYKDDNNSKNLLIHIPSNCINLWFLTDDNDVILSSDLGIGLVSIWPSPKFCFNIT